MTLIADLDLDLLKDLNTSGAVRNLRDRRRDRHLYTSDADDDKRGDELLNQGEERAPRTGKRKAIAAG